ncbi:MAG: RNA methyltransferase [Desulfovibrio sp.]|nr:RNA methyltransferase [Desulfovibrio sp.]
MHTTAHSEVTLLPGLKPVLELLTTSPGRIDSIFCKKGLHNAEIQKILTLCRQLDIHYTLVEQAALDRLCRTKNRSRQGGDAVGHQGVVARLAGMEYCRFADLLNLVPKAPLPIVIALDQVQDPGNVGTLCRTLYALGGAGMVLPLHNTAYLGPAAHRASAGALEQLPIARVTNLAHALDSAEEAGFAIYGTGTGPNSQDVLSHPMHLPCILVLGNENKGLRPGVVKRCAHMLRIPLIRHFDSLNVAQAGAILLGLALAKHVAPDA